jgi:hypothetical protein
MSCAGAPTCQCLDCHVGHEDGTDGAGATVSDHQEVARVVKRHARWSIKLGGGQRTWQATSHHIPARLSTDHCPKLDRRVGWLAQQPGQLWNRPICPFTTCAMIISWVAIHMHLQMHCTSLHTCMVSPLPCCMPPTICIAPCACACECLHHELVVGGVHVDASDAGGAGRVCDVTSVCNKHLQVKGSKTMVRQGS